MVYLLFLEDNTSIILIAKEYLSYVGFVEVVPVVMNKIYMELYFLCSYELNFVNKDDPNKNSEVELNLCKTATLKRQKISFQDQLSLNTVQKYCRMLQGKHYAILSTFIKLSIVIKIFVFFLHF